MDARLRALLLSQSADDHKLARTYAVFMPDEPTFFDVLPMDLKKMVDEYIVKGLSQHVAEKEPTFSPVVYKKVHYPIVMTRSGPWAGPQRTEASEVRDFVVNSSNPALQAIYFEECLRSFQALAWTSCAMFSYSAECAQSVLLQLLGVKQPRFFMIIDALGTGVDQEVDVSRFFRRPPLMYLNHGEQLVVNDAVYCWRMIKQDPLMADVAEGGSEDA